MASSVVASSSFSMSCFSCARSARISSNRLFKRPNSLIFSWSSNLTYRMGMFISMGCESTRPHEHLRQLPLLDLMPWFQWATFCGISSKFTMRMNDNKFWSNKPLITRNTNAKFISKSEKTKSKQMEPTQTYQIYSGSLSDAVGFLFFPSKPHQGLWFETRISKVVGPIPSLHHHKILRGSYFLRSDNTFAVLALRKLPFISILIVTLSLVIHWTRILFFIWKKWRVRERRCKTITMSS